MASNPIAPIRVCIFLIKRFYGVAAETVTAAKTTTTTITSSAPAKEGLHLKARKNGTNLYRRLSELGGAPEGSVSSALNKWLREGNTVAVSRLVIYVKELRKYRQYKNALEVMDWMVKTKGMNLSCTNHAICLDLISNVRGISSAEQYFHALPDSMKKQQTYGALLNCYCANKMVNKAMAHYEKMEELGLAINTLVHNNLMSLFVKVGQPEKVISQFQVMKTNNIAPDSFTYSILMSSYASLGDIDASEGVMKDMEESGTVVGWSAYSTLAAIFSSSGLTEKAESVLQKLEKRIDGRSRDPYHFLISLYAGTRNLAEVNRVWKSLKTAFPKLTNMSYLVMLQALGNAGSNIDEIKQVFEEWESVRKTHDFRLTNVMIRAYLRNDMVEEAEALKSKVTAVKGVGFDFRMPELFIDYYLKKNDVGLALKVLGSAALMVKDGEWKLNPELSKGFFKCFQEAKDVKSAEIFLQTLRKLKSSNAEAYESLINTYIAAGKKDPTLAQRIEEDGIELNSEARKLLKMVCSA